MATRVTQSMMNNTFMRNLMSSNRKMETYLNQLATSKRINLPGDDPVGTARSMYYRSNIVEVNKYVDNANMAKTWLQQTEGALDDVLQTMQRVREINVQASNEILNEESRKAVAEELDQLRQHIDQVANTSIAGRYIFGGTNTWEPPSHDGKWKGNDGDISVEIGANLILPMNTAGEKIFDYQSTAGRNMFGLIEKISTDLKDPDQLGKPITSYLSEVDDQIANLLNHISEIGARENRLDFNINRLEGLNLSLEEARSQAEDVDMPKVITDLKTQENVYRAALGAGSRIIQPSLLDFLR